MADSTQMPSKRWTHLGGAGGHSQGRERDIGSGGSGRQAFTAETHPYQTAPFEAEHRGRGAGTWAHGHMGRGAPGTGTGIEVCSQFVQGSRAGVSHGKVLGCPSCLGKHWLGLDDEGQGVFVPMWGTRPQHMKSCCQNNRLPAAL